MNALLMAVIEGAGGTESEPVLVEVDLPNVTLTLDTGVRLTLDREELRLLLDAYADRERAA